MLFGTRAAADAATAADAAGDETVTIADIAAAAIEADAAAKDPTSLLLVPEGMEGIAVLPESLATVPAYAFSRCAKLSAISLSGSTGASFSCQDGILYNVDATELLAAPAGIGSTVAIASSCERIAEGAFYGNIDLKTIAVTGVVTTIAEESFSQKAIEGATVAITVDAASYDAAKAAWEAAGFTNFADPAEPGTTIEPTEGSGFAFTLLDDYTLAVRWSGDDAAPAKLEVPVYGLIEGVQYKVSSIADEGFAGQAEIQQVVLPDGLTSIGASAFEGATELNTISVPGNVSAIGEKAFANCDSLVALELSEGLRTIGDAAFQGIAQKAVVLPASVKAVGDYAFANSPNLQMVVALGTVEEVGPNALAGAAGLSLYVPYNEAEDYAWSAGLPAAGNHLLPYGVKLTEEIINVKVDEDAVDLFEGGYLKAPEGFEVNYAYKAKPISISDDGMVEAKDDGSSNVDVVLTLNVPKQVINGIVSQEAKLTPAAYSPNSAPTVRTAEVVESVQPVTLTATASVQSEARATASGKTITFRTTTPNASNQQFQVGHYRIIESAVTSITFTNVTSMDINSDGTEFRLNYDASPVGYNFYPTAGYDMIITDTSGVGWTLDPTRRYATNVNNLPSSLNSCPDGTTFWLADYSYGSNGELTFVADQNTTLSYVVSNGNTVVQTSTIQPNASMRFYSVSDFVNRETGFVFGAKLTASTSSTYYTITVTGASSTSGYTFAGFKYGLSNTSTVSTNSATIPTYPATGITGWTRLHGDTEIIGFSSYTTGGTVTVIPNGYAKRYYSSTPSSTTIFTSSFTATRVTKVTSRYVGGTWELALQRNGADTIIVTTAYSTDSMIGWSGNYPSTVDSSWDDYLHMLEGTYDIGRDTVSITAIRENPTGTSYGWTSDWEVLTGPIADTTYANKTLYQISYIRALSSGDYELLASYYHTLATPQSVLMKTNNDNIVGLTTNPWNASTRSSFYECVFIRGEKYIPRKSGSSKTLYNVYSSCTLNFNLNLPQNATLNGSNYYSPVSGLYGRTPTTVAAPKAYGYQFTGFYSFKSGGVAIYDSTGKAANVFYGMDLTNTLYAHWTPNTITVTYDANGGSGTMSSQTIRTEGTSTVLNANTFTRSGYVIDHWNTKSDDSGTSYALGQDLRANINNTTEASQTLPLYAIWSPNRTVVNFNGNENTGGTMDQQTILYSDTTKTLTKNAFTRDYYTFKGWGRTATATKATYADQATITVSGTTATTTLDLFAVWSANYVKVTMHPNGADGEDWDIGTYYYNDETWILPSNKYVRPGYTFMGWATSPTGAVVYENNADIVDAISATVEASTLDLYAVWKAGYIDVPINYYLQNADDDGYTFSESMSRTQECLVGQSYSPSVFGTVTYYTRNLIEGDVFPKTIEGDGSTEFNIYWDRNKYSVTFGFSGDVPEGVEAPATIKYKHGATVTLPTVNSQGTCIFKGWSVNDSTDLLPNGATFVMPTRATTVTGVWEYDGKYTVVYDQGFNGEQQTGPTDSTVYHAGEAVTLAQNDPDAGGFVREGYIFLGWSTTPGHTNTGFRPGQQVVLDNWIDVGVVTLYAVWGPQVNVSTPITPALTLMVKPDSDGMTGTLSESLAANANFFQSQTPENVLVSSMQCAPIEGANGTKNVFVDEELWPFISVKLTTDDGSQVDLPISEATSLRSFSMADDNKFIIPANSGLPVSVDMAIPRYVQIAIEQANVEVARLKFTFQLTGEDSEAIVPESAQAQA